MRFFVILGCIFVIFALVPYALGLQSEEKGIAEKLYKSGLSFYKSGKYGEALKDFGSVLSSYPKSKWAPLSLFQKGVYYFKIAKNYKQAKDIFSSLVKTYPSNPKSSEGLYYSGFISLQMANSSLELNSALSEFERVIKIYPKAKISALAALDAARIYRRRGEIKKALQKIQLIGRRFRKSELYLDALLLKGILLVGDGQHAEAARQLQAVINAKRNSQYALKAKRYLSALQRLVIQQHYAYRFDSSFYLEKLKQFDDPVVMRRFDDSKVAIFDSGHEKVYLFNSSGKLIKSDYLSRKTEGFFADRHGVYYINDSSNHLKTSSGEMSLETVSGGEKKPLEEPYHIEIDSYSNMYMVDRDRENIYRFGKNGGFITRFTKLEFGDIVSLRIDNHDRVYILDQDKDSILILNRTGHNISKIKKKGKNYSLNEPTLLQFDDFNNLYVYDEDLNAILIFDAKGNYLKNISVQPPVESVLSFAVTDAAEILILDKDKLTVFKLH